MAKLKVATRNKLASSAFGLPGQRKYPMEDRTHQIKAEEFATKEENKGKLSPAQAARIRAKARQFGEAVRVYKISTKYCQGCHDAPADLQLTFTRVCRLSGSKLDAFHHAVGFERGIYGWALQEFNQGLCRGHVGCILSNYSGDDRGNL